MSWRAACRSFGRSGSASGAIERAAVRDRERVDQGDVAGDGHLDQAESRVVGAFADELGVERDGLCRRPRRNAGRERLGIADGSFAGGHHHLIMRMPPPRPKAA